METISETPKPKVRRPKSKYWDVVKKLGPFCVGGCARAKLDEARMISIFSAATKDRSDEEQRLAIGAANAEIRNGTGKIAPGFKPTAIEATRWCESSGATHKQAVDIIIEARRRGSSYPEIHAHFRRIRLGDRQGTKTGFLHAIERAINDHLRRFSGTDKATITGFLREYVEALEKSV